MVLERVFSMSVHFPFWVCFLDVYMLSFTGKSVPATGEFLFLWFPFSAFATLFL